MAIDHDIQMQIEEDFVLDGGEILVKKAPGGYVVYHMTRKRKRGVPSVEGWGKAKSIDKARELAILDLADFTIFSDATPKEMNGWRRDMKHTFAALVTEFGFDPD